MVIYIFASVEIPQAPAKKNNKVGPQSLGDCFSVNPQFVGGLNMTSVIWNQSPRFHVHKLAEIFVAVGFLILFLIYMVLFVSTFFG